MGTYDDYAPRRWGDYWLSVFSVIGCDYVPVVGQPNGATLCTRLCHQMHCECVKSIAGCRPTHASAGSPKVCGGEGAFILALPRGYAPLRDKSSRFGRYDVLEQIHYVVCLLITFAEVSTLEVGKQVTNSSSTTSGVARCYPTATSERGRGWVGYLP